MKTFPDIWMAGFLALPLLGLPFDTSGQLPEKDALEGVRQPARPPGSQSPLYSPRSERREGPGSPGDRSWTPTTEALRCVSDAHVLFQGTDSGSERRPGIRSPTRATLPNGEFPIGAGRWPASEPSGFRYTADLPYARTACVPAETGLALRCKPVGLSRFGKVGSALAALFGLGAWGASRSRRSE